MKKKVIRDTVHTYIDIDENVRSIIDTESFQRLKYIKQLTIQHLYPAANHTRFEHSLGVMHLSLVFFEKIKDKLIELKDKDGSQTNNSNLNLDYNDLFFNPDYLKDHLLYASLLHDVGHAPFSHACESLLIKKDIIDNIEREIKCNNLNITVDYLKKEYLNDKDVAAHELMSCYVIIRKFTKKLVFCYYKPDNENVSINLEFIFRIICGIKYTSNDDSDHIRRIFKNTIISIVNSEAIDVDKIDYLLRDNKVVGYIGPRLDVNRLIMSATVNTQEGGLLFSKMGISALQGLIDCRDVLYLWVYNHHTVVYTDFLYYKCFSQFFKLNLSYKDFSKWFSIPLLFTCEAIADDCVSDIDALHMIKKAHRLIKKGEITCANTVKIINQLINRKYLKPLWKTLNQYNDFISECGYKNEKQKEKITKYISNSLNRSRLIVKISKVLNIQPGNIFIVKRENNFCERILKNLQVMVNDKPKHLNDLLPIKDHEAKYQKTAFYVYCENGFQDNVKKELIENLKEIEPVKKDEQIKENEQVKELFD